MSGIGFWGVLVVKTANCKIDNIIFMIGISKENILELKTCVVTFVGCHIGVYWCFCGFGGYRGHGLVDGWRQCR